MSQHEANQDQEEARAGPYDAARAERRRARPGRRGRVQGGRLLMHDLPGGVAGELRQPGLRQGVAMKPIKPKKKLELDRTTLRALSGDELGQVAGAASLYLFSTCESMICTHKMSSCLAPSVKA